MGHAPRLVASLSRAIAVFSLMAGCAGPAAEDDGGESADVAAVDTGQDIAVSKPDTGATDSGVTAHDSGPAVDAGCKTVADCPNPAGPCDSARCRADGTCAIVDLCQCKEAADCAAFDDGNACNGTLFCDKTAPPYRCRFKPGSAVACSTLADTACKTTACEPKTGKCVATNAPKGTLCSDGQVCTSGDACESGACKAGTFICECEDAKDCAAYEDGNLCNGVLFCDKSKPMHKCVVSPTTVVHCTGKATACSTDSCDTKTGKCVTKSAPDGTVCDDGNKCTHGDACKAGACVKGDVDTCSCKSQADCGPLEDGDACNGTLYCDKTVTPNKCTVNPATVVQCPTSQDTACLKNACYLGTGLCQLTITEKLEKACTGSGSKQVCTFKLLPPKAPPAQAGPCEDGNKCTTGEACKAGKCAGGTDICGCKVDGDCTQKLDNVCAGTLFCNKATGQCDVNPAKAVVCKSFADTDCAKNACAPKTGTCAATPLGKTKKICAKAGGKEACRYEVSAGAGEIPGLPCSDGDACTTGETCAGGKCTGGASICTCKTNADCAKEGGNKCLGTHYCDQKTHKCALNPATKVTCSKASDTACLANTCQPKSGKCALQPANEAHPCDDKNACTKGDLCKAGSCAPGTNTCECWLDADCKTKDDGNACNGTLYCDKSGKAPKCTLNPASIPVCNKAYPTPCLKHICNPKTGACGPGAANEAASCDDGSKCTTADACKAGSCVGKALKCNDNNACTQDTCDPKVGCKNLTKHCNDSNPCTVDQCDAKTAKCSFVPVVGKAIPCDADGNGCTVNDVCKAGTCAPGTPVSCKVPTKVCQQAVCKSTSPTAFSCVVAQSPKGTACDDGDACTVGSVCIGGTCDGSGKQKFFTQTYVVSADAKPADQGAWRAVAGASNGELVLAGAAWSGSQANTRWWVMRTDAAGAPKWQTTVVGKAESTAQMATGAIAAADGSSYVAGTIAAGGGDLNGQVVRFDASGKAKWHKQYGSVGNVETVAGMVGEPTVDLTIAGGRTVKSITRAWVQRIGADGSAVWSAELGGTGYATEATAVVRFSDGGAAVAGWRKDNTKKTTRGLLARWDKAGKLMWSRTLGSGAENRLHGLALRSDGSLIAVGRKGTTKAPFAWFIAADASGKPEFSDAQQAGGQLHAVAAGKKARFVATGSLRPLGSDAGLWIKGADDLANTRWQRTLPSVGGSVAHAIAGFGGSGFGGNGLGGSGLGGSGFGGSGFGDDGLVVAGQRISGGKTVGYVARIDPWGHDSCAAAGACLGKKSGACDDGKRCTADRCDGKKGCVSATVDALRCEVEDGCTLHSACLAGKCPTAKEGRLFDRVADVGARAAPYRVSRMPDGGFVWTGQDPSPGQYAVVVRTDEYGNELWRDRFRFGGLGWGAGVCGTSDGRVVAVTRGFQGSTTGQIAVWDKEGKRLSMPSGLHNWVWWRPLALFCFDDGSFGTVQEYTRYAAYSMHVYKYNSVYKSAWAANKVNFGSFKAHIANNHLYWPGTAYGFGAAAHKDGSAVVAGTIRPRSGSSKYRGWMGRYEKGGKLAWQKTTVDSGRHLYFFDAAARPGGGVVAAGLKSHVAGSGQPGWLMARDKAGKVVWEQTVSPVATLQFYGLDVAADGSTTAVGFARVNAQYRMWMGRYDPVGKPIFTRMLPHIGRLSDAIVLAGGDSVLVGRDESKGTTQTRPRMLRVDAWGHAGCAEAGGCGKKKAADCNDGKACTADVCDAKKGCVFIAIKGCGP